jgi:hypothetical protein
MLSSVQLISIFLLYYSTLSIHSPATYYFDDILEFTKSTRSKKLFL